MADLREIYGPYAPLLFSALRIVGILILGYFILRLIDSGLNRLRLLIPPSDSVGVIRIEQRTETLRHIIRSICKAIIVLVLTLMISSELGFNIGPVLASAGIVGLAVGFGAQSLVKDVISGFFILFEDQFGVGDAVRIGDFTGTVERMSLRATVLRNLEGQVYVVANGNIQNVRVMTKEWARAVLDVSVPHNQDLSKVFEILKTTGMQLAKEWPERLLDEPTVLGVERLDDFGVTVRAIVKTPAFKDSDVLREWRRKVQEEFVKRGIEFSRQLREKR